MNLLTKVQATNKSYLLKSAFMKIQSFSQSEVQKIVAEISKTFTTSN